MRQVVEMISLFMTFFLLQLPFLVVWNVIKKKKFITNMGIIAITAYIVVIISLTLWPPAIGQPPIGWSELTYNIKPFDSIIGSLNYSYYLVGIRNVLGNFVILLPLAFLIKQKGSIRILWLGFSISLSIELAQLVLTKYGLIFRRSIDIDDLILNTSGFYFGYLLKACIAIVNRRIRYKNVIEREQL